MARFLGLRGKSLATAISVTCGFCFLYVDMPFWIIALMVRQLM